MGKTAVRGLLSILTVMIVTSNAVDIASLVDCSNTGSYINGMQKCLDLYDIPVTIPDPDLLSNNSGSTDLTANLLSQLNITILKELCRPENREDYISGSTCILSISRKCLEGNSDLQPFIPTDAKIRQQIEFQCNSLGGFNQGCVFARLPALQNCTSTAGLSGIPPENSTDNSAICANFELSRFCVKKHLAACGESTVQIYEQSLPNLDICDNDTDSNGGVPGSQSGDCNSIGRARKSYLTCQVEAGIFILLPHFTTSDEMSEYTLRNIAVHQHSEVCREMSGFKSLINCTLAVQRQCHGDSQQTLVPDLQEVMTGFQELCKNIENYDGNCVGNVTTKINCTRASGSELCNEKREDIECYSDRVKMCGEETASLYQDLLSSQLPQVCLKFDNPEVESAGFRPTMSLVALVITFLLFH